MTAAILTATESEIDDYTPYDGPSLKKPAPSSPPLKWTPWPEPKTSRATKQESSAQGPMGLGSTGVNPEYCPGHSDPGRQNQACKGECRTEVDQYAYVPSVQQQRRDEKIMMAKRVKWAKKEASRRRREGRIGESRVEGSHGKGTHGRNDQSRKEGRCRVCPVM